MKECFKCGPAFFHQILSSVLNIVKAGGYHRLSSINKLKLLLSVYFDRKTKLGLIVPGRHGKYTFTQERFNLQGIHKDTNEQDTFFSSFLDCKHKHMMKNGAPPDKVGVLFSLLPVELYKF